MSPIKNKTLSASIEKLFGGLLSEQSITEIAINKFGELLIEKNNKWQKAEKIFCQNITKEKCETLANALASATQGKDAFGKDNPIFSGTLIGGERIQVVAPPACDKKQFSITVRKHSVAGFTTDDLEKSGLFSEIVIKKETSEEDLILQKLLEKQKYKEFFEQAVACGTKNIVIAGATGSGKTTFMRSLIDHIPFHERLITIEDVRELYLKDHFNHVNLLYSAESETITATNLLKSCLRMKPDRILLAECRGSEAYDYLNVISSGHGGSITSLHAGTAEEAMQRLAIMVKQNPMTHGYNYNTVQEIIANTIDIITHVGITNGKRRLTFIHWKDFKDAKS